MPALMGKYPLFHFCLRQLKIANSCSYSGGNISLKPKVFPFSDVVFSPTATICGISGHPLFGMSLMTLRTCNNSPTLLSLDLRALSMFPACKIYYYLSYSGLHLKISLHISLTVVSTERL